jgi:hypothetical protein
MKIFFDTEFTGLHKNTTLISIGLIDENDRSFYAEFTDYDESQCNEWIKENVINNLKHKGVRDLNLKGYNPRENKTWIIGNKKEVYDSLCEWLSTYDNVELVSDCCHYDMVLFIDIFGGAFDIPSNINPVCHDINQDIARYYEFSEKEAFDFSREEILQNNKITIKGNKHNSLYDAKVIKAIYEIIKSHGLI